MSDRTRKQTINRRGNRFKIHCDTEWKIKESIKCSNSKSITRDRCIQQLCLWYHKQRWGLSQSHRQGPKLQRIKKSRSTQNVVTISLTCHGHDLCDTIFPLYYYNMLTLLLCIESNMEV